MKKLSVLLLVLITVELHAQHETYDLAIRHANVFDTNTGKVNQDQTILVQADKIAGVVSSKTIFTAKQIVDAKGKLVIPGLIDVHGHLTNVLGDYEKAPLHISPDSINVYRECHALTYLPYGVTTVRQVGDPEQWIPMELGWQKNPGPSYPDIFCSGAALVSKEENRKTYIGHAVVNDPADAARKVQAYYNMGIRDIKLYWRLRYPELQSALHKAQSLGMHVSAHIDRGVTARDSVVRLGVRDLEHLHPYAIEYLSSADMQQVMQSTRQWYPSAKGGFLGWQMEVFHKLGKNHPKMLQSIALLKRYGVSLTPTISVFGQAVGLSYIKTPVTIEEGGLNSEDFTPAQKQRCLEGYRIMISYLKQMYEAGVALNLGTDCPDGGRSALAELLLLHESGIPMPAVLQIGTINSARAIGRENLYGSIDKGKKADFIIFERDPLDKATNLLSKKIVIKDGKVYQDKD